jgi:hypothetical protein
MAFRVRCGLDQDAGAGGVYSSDRARSISTVRGCAAPPIPIFRWPARRWLLIANDEIG